MPTQQVWPGIATVDYCGRILTEPYTDSLRRRVADCVRRFQTFERTGIPVLPYIAAWREERKIIWYEYVSGRLCELLGCRPPEASAYFRDRVLDRKVYRFLETDAQVEKEIIAGQQLRNVREGLRKEGESTGLVEAVYKIGLPEGRVVWLKDQAIVERHPADRAAISLGCLTDVTKEMAAEEERDRAQQALRQYAEELRAAKEVEERNARELARANDDLEAAKEDAEAANKAKSEFLAVVSHEIRTPMNAILGLTDITLQTPLSDEQREYLNNVKDSARHLLAIINDILDISKVEAGKLSLEERVFPIRPIFESTLKPLRIQAEQKGLQIDLNIAPAVPEWLWGDAGRLRQILVNLVGNAIKFTSRGRIDVCVSEASNSEHRPPPETPDDAATLILTVRDTGIGIPRDQQEAIFENFRQLPPAPGSSKHAGTGLGLAICRNLVQLMGGEIHVRSRRRAGTAFDCSLQLRVACASDASPGDESGPRDEEPVEEPLRVLVAEDNELNVQVVSVFLSRRGHQVHVAADGIEALAALEAGSYDLVLMDLDMPRLDGLEAARRIRRGEAGEGNRRIPLIAMTAHTLPEIQSECQAVGMNDYVVKPVDLDQLVAAIRSLCIESGAGTASRPKVSDGGLLDTAAALDRLGGDAGVLRKLYGVFVRKIPRVTAEITAALEHGDLEEVRRQAHSFKGASGIIGADSCHQLASGLEQEARRRRTEGTRAAAERLFHELDAVNRVLSEILTGD